MREAFLYFLTNTSGFPQLWQPNLLFEDQYQSEARNERLWSDFLVIMESGPLADDITRVREGKMDYSATSCRIFPKMSL